jgi:hypothetical protein
MRCQIWGVREVRNESGYHEWYLLSERFWHVHQWVVDVRHRLLFSTYHCMNIRKVSDWNQNMINEVYSVTNIAIGEVINNIDSLYVLEDYKDDFMIFKSRLIASWVSASRGNQILKYLIQWKHYNFSLVNKKYQMYFLASATVIRWVRYFSMHFTYCYQVNMCGIIWCF